MTEKFNRNTDSQYWIKEAQKQTIPTLMQFMYRVMREFPGWEGCYVPYEERTFGEGGFYASQEAKQFYQNGIIAGVLCSIATYQAIATMNGWSCNQAGVVRNMIYQSFFDEKKIDFNLL